MKKVLITINNVKFNLKQGSGCFLYLANTEYGEEVYGYTSIDMNDVERAMSEMKVDTVSANISIEGMYVFNDGIKSDLLKEYRVAEVAPVGIKWPDGWRYASEAIVKVERNYITIIIILTDQTQIESPPIYPYNGPAMEKVASDLSIDLKNISKEDIKLMEDTIAFRRVITNTIALGQSSIAKQEVTGTNPAENKIEDRFHGL